MGHVIIRTISPVTDIDMFGSVRNRKAVNHLAKGVVFVLLVDGLQKGIRISMSVQIIKSIDMNTIKPLG